MTELHLSHTLCRACPRLAAQGVVDLLHGPVLQPLEGYNMTWLPC